MPSRTTLTAATLVTLLLAAASARAEGEVFEDRIAVKLAVPAADDASASAVLQKIGLDLEKRSLLGWVVAHVRKGDTVRAAVDRAHATVEIAKAEPIQRMHLHAAPNDPLYPQQWGFDAIEMEPAWDITVGDYSQRIGVVDSGINRSHVDLAPVDVGGFDFISDPQLSFDGDGRDSDYSDVDAENNGEFHGSHTSGTIAASANDGVGVAGVNWGAGLMSARAINNGPTGGNEIDVMEAAAWLAGFHVDGVPDIGANQVQVINMSLGFDGACDDIETDIIGAILQAGVVVVASSGNNPSAPTSAPAACDGVIAVSAFGPDFQIASYATFDNRVDVVGPGGDSNAGYGNAGEVLSVDGGTYDNYHYLEGTSMAAPHVTGVVSLMLSVNPTLSPAQIRSILQSGSYTCTSCNNIATLDALDALHHAQSVAGAFTTARGGNGASLYNQLGALCPANAHPLPDYSACDCNAGFTIDSAGDACVSSSGNPGTTTPPGNTVPIQQGTPPPPGDPSNPPQDPPPSTNPPPSNPPPSNPPPSNPPPSNPPPSNPPTQSDPSNPPQSTSPPPPPPPSSSTPPNRKVPDFNSSNGSSTGNGDTEHLTGGCASTTKGESAWAGLALAGFALVRFASRRRRER
jgi:subtilisin family serine protease